MRMRRWRDQDFSSGGVGCVASGMLTSDSHFRPARVRWLLQPFMILAYDARSLPSAGAGSILIRLRNRSAR
ncbi:MAG: hypothetical protein D6766_07280 [Verrucomicrobia bacterium]|nr:MAG: hypothetical protein D6766_07280 [Verrucomicrobiota bacterium]